MSCIFLKILRYTEIVPQLDYLTTFCHLLEGLSEEKLLSVRVCEKLPKN